MVDEEDRYKVYATETGVVSLPAGNYRIGSVTLVRADTRGRMWKTVITLMGANGRVRVRSRQETAIVCGPPFTLHMKLGDDRDRTLALAYRRDRAGELTKAGPRDLSIRLSCRDRADNFVFEIQGPDGRKTMPPTFRASAPTGEKVDTTPFEYG
jgi:hypothetical protein